MEFQSQWLLLAALLAACGRRITAMECEGNDFACADAQSCIPMGWVCDADIDCDDASDEVGCTPTTCEDGQFKCENNQCVPGDWKCDGASDCRDGTDEQGCPPPTCNPEYQFTCADGTCIHSAWRCDGDLDCVGGEDEFCGTNVSCHAGEARCADGRECINQHWICDGEPDCRDGSDEAGCPTGECHSFEWKCANGNCIPGTYVCDSDNDCGDNSDEHCPSPSPGSCRATEFLCSSGGCIRSSWRCDGDNDCGDLSDEKDCPNFACPAGETKCATENRCYTARMRCDTVNNCFDASDELHCPTPQRPNLCGHNYHCGDTTCVNHTQLCDGHRDCLFSGKDEKDCTSQPVDECATLTHGCSDRCVDTQGSYYCTCQAGFVLGEDHRGCVDIDECDALGTCSQHCANTVGSFVCSCATGYFKYANSRCHATGPSGSLIFSNREEIRQLYLDGTKYETIIPSQRNAIALDYHYQKNLLFWTDITLDVIMSSFINGSNIRTIVHLGLTSPGGISVDWMNDLLYWTDSGSGRIEAGSLDGTKRQVVVHKGVDKPRAIVLDPCRGVMYWTDWGAAPKIEKSSLDGTRREVLVSDGLVWPNGLTLDIEAQRLYWVDGKLRELGTVRADGTGRLIMLAAVEGLVHPFAITVVEDTLLWTDWQTKTIYRASKFDGSQRLGLQTNLLFPMDLQIYHPLRQPQCASKRCPPNHGCQYMCLPRLAPAGDLPYRCVCGTGYKLEANNRTCNFRPKEFILFSRQQEIRRAGLDSGSFIDTVIPYHSMQSIVALDYHYKTRTVYWSDVVADTISRGNDRGTEQAVIVGTALGSPAGLAVDWATEKLYWTDAGNDFIEVSNLDGSQRTVVISTGLDRPRDIIVDPYDRKMYWTDWGLKPKIEVAYMDGSDRKALVTTNVTWPNGLALDVYGGSGSTRRLYWVDAGFKTIESIRLDGSGRMRILAGDFALPHPFGITVYGGHIYWTDWQTESLQRSDLNGNSRVTLVGDLPSLMDVKIFHEPQELDATPRCMVDNGGCSHLCLLGSNAAQPTCKCPTGVQLQADGKTCNLDLQNYLVVSRRSAISRISLDVAYRKEAPLPLPNLENAIALDVDRANGLLFWTDGQTGRISRSTVTGQNVATVQEIAIETPDGIALDTASQLVYWTDTNTDRIEVCTYSGLHRRVLIWQDLQSPRALSLDVAGGYMYWTDWGKNARIERAWLDGSHREALVTTDIEWPNGLTLDLPNQLMYWVDAKFHTLERTRFDGSGRVQLAAGLEHPYGLTILGEALYWTDWQERAILQYNVITRNVSTVILHLANQMDIHGVSTADVPVVTGCSVNNGDCDQLCLNTPAGPQCACSTGLNATQFGTCPSVPSEFLLFSTRTSIRRISLDTEDKTNIIIIPNQENAIAVDFHASSKTIFWSDVSLDKILSSEYDGSNQKTVVSNVSTPDGIAVDWIGDHIYWTDTGTDSIEVARLDGSGRKVLIREDLDEPRDITLYPTKGLMFWSDWGNDPKIERSNMAGLERMTLVSDMETVPLGWPNGLTIDFAQDRLYWADAREDTIESVNLNGSARKTVFRNLPHAFGLAAFRSQLYWTDWQHHTVSTGMLDGTGQAVVDANLKFLMDIQVVSAERQQGTNACAGGDNACTSEQLCVPIAGNAYRCVCPDSVSAMRCGEHTVMTHSIPRPGPAVSTQRVATTPATTGTGVAVASATSDQRDGTASQSAGPAVTAAVSPASNDPSGGGSTVTPDGGNGVGNQNTGTADLSSHVTLFVGVGAGCFVLMVAVFLFAILWRNKANRKNDQVIATAITTGNGYRNPAFGSNASVEKSPSLKSPMSSSSLIPEHMSGYETTL